MKILIFLLLCTMSFYGGLIMQRPSVNYIEYQSVYIPIELPIKKTKYVGMQIDSIAAAIPESALQH